MRKLEGVVKEVVDEMNYLKTREERFQATNSASSLLFSSLLFLMHLLLIVSVQCLRTHEYRTLPSSCSSPSSDVEYGKSSTYELSSNASTSLIELRVIGVILL